MAQDPIQLIRELDDKRATIVSAAKKEALERANNAIAELRALGFNYQLTENGAAGPGARRKAAATAPGKGIRSGTLCPVCEFTTEPPHDARKHRAQGKRKRAFTPKQLEELGLTKV